MNTPRKNIWAGAALMGALLSASKCAVDWNAPTLIDLLLIFGGAFSAAVFVDELKNKP